MEPTLMRNSSQNAGCMRRSPASHCCQVRQVVCTSAPAAVCDRPAASRAARTSSGVGLRAAEAARERLGWLGIVFGESADKDAAEGFVGENLVIADIAAIGANARVDGAESELRGGDEGAVVRESHVVELGVGVGDGFGDLLVHFLLQPLIPEARFVGVDNLNNTRNARKVKSFLQINYEGGSKPSNAALTGAEGRSPKASG